MHPKTTGEKGQNGGDQSYRGSAVRVGGEGL